MKKIHLICNAHLDPIWQWTWDEGISAAIATFKSAADLADEFDYIFCHNEALLYEAIEKYAPELFVRIQALVKAGKWRIMGGWYVQPDVNMPSGESLLRQIEVGKQYFKEKFGAEPTVAANFDSFGHSLGLVQILAKSGYTGYICCRPADCYFHAPGKFFKWTGPDGSSVAVAKTGSYNSALGHSVDKIRDEASRAEDVDFVLWGVGNHGGGPSRKDLRDIMEFSNENSDVTVMHSYPEALFADDIRIAGEVTTPMRPMFPGCYSSMAKVKQAHRKTENLLYGTEKMMAAARLAGHNFDLAPLEDAQKRLLLAEFHDILPGSSVAEGEAEGLELLATARKIAKDYRTEAFVYLAMRQEKAGEGEYPIFVFNYQPYPLHTNVEAEFTLADQNWGEDRYVCRMTKDGEPVFCQQIKEDGTLNLDWRKRLLFEADLAPLSLTRFTVKTEIAPYKQDWMPHSADLDEWLADVPLLSAPAVPALYEDSADPWAMRDVDHQHMGSLECRPFRLMTEEEGQAFCKTGCPMPPVHITESGDVMECAEAFYTLDNTNAVVAYRKYKHADYVDVTVTVEFAGKNELLRLCIPAPAGKLMGDGPYIIEDKESGEVPFQKWLGVGDESGENIFAVLNDGDYSGTYKDGCICLTLLRGSGYLYHPIMDRQLYPWNRYMPRIDCGRYVYHFRIMRGSRLAVTRAAEEFNEQPYAINAFPIGLDPVDVGFSVEGDVAVGALRPDRDGGYTLRLFNPATKPADATVHCKEKTVRLTLGAHAFETVKL